MIEAERKISRLAAALMAIGNLPLEFNTRARAIAQEAIGKEPDLADQMKAAGGFWDPMTEEQFYKILRREKLHRPAPADKLQKREKTMNTNTTNTTTTEQPQAAPYVPPVIEMIPVTSSNVESIGHDGDKVLRIKFKNSGRAAYDYVGIMPEDFFGLVNSDSVGKAYNAFVKEREIKGIKIEVPEI